MLSVCYWLIVNSQLQELFKTHRRSGQWSTVSYMSDLKSQIILFSTILLITPIFL